MRVWTHVLVPETKVGVPGADRKAMQTQDLKRLVEEGSYKPDPSLIAAAMLERRGVRELLSFTAAIGPAGRSRRSATIRHRAA